MDVLKEIVAGLSSMLDVRVATERPANPPKTMVTVVRTGGGGSRFMDSPRIIVHAWGQSEDEAYKLGREAEQAMFALPSYSDNIAEVTQNSFYSNIYTDGTRRWSGAYVLVCNR